MSRSPVYFEDLPVGKILESPEREISAEDMHAYNVMTHSSGAVHDDIDHAQHLGFKERLVPGPFVLAAGLPLHGLLADQKLVALVGFEKVSFPSPVYPGDRIRMVSEVMAARHTKKPDRGLVTFHDRALNQRHETVMDLTRLVMYERREPGDSAPV